MRNLIIGLILTLAIIGGWFIAWNMLLAKDVARVKDSIAFHYKELRTVNPTMSLEADSVSATGFPFRFQIAVKRATLSMVEGEQTYAISIPLLTMEATNKEQGIYRVNLPATVEALYAKQGAAPENYRVTASALPKLNLSAADSKNRCGPLTGQRCNAVAEDVPLVSYALGLPGTVILHMELGTETKEAQFNLPAIEVPIYRPIPKDLRHPLQMFVGILREALVYKTGTVQ